VVVFKQANDSLLKVGSKRSTLNDQCAAASHGTSRDAINSAQLFGKLGGYIPSRVQL